MGSENWPSPNKNIKYEKGENRLKHVGATVEACMVQAKGNTWIGKCPKGFSPDIAQEIIETAFPEFRNSTADRPFRLWAYHDGVIYAARSQDGGATWHGYPNGHPMQDPPRKILRLLQQRAQAAGEIDKFKAWLKKRWSEK